MKVTLPFNYKPRDYQLPFLAAFDDNIYHGGSIKKFVIVWHRRSGKDKTIVNVIAKAMQQRVGAYYYFFPTFTQGKKILWEGIDKDGFKFIDHFPAALIKGKPNDSEMKIKYKNGSLFQIIGTDNFNGVVGSNPVGCVFSEYALQDPKAWDFMRPILAENDGFVIFDFTPRGENHGKDIYDMAVVDKEHWFSQLLTVEDTKAIKQDILDVERKEIVKLHGNDALYQQEYMCSFTAPLPGAYYASHIATAERENRLTSVPYDPAVPVDTYWDLGVDDSMTIIYSQIVGKEIRFIDYTEANGEGLPYYADIMQKKGYVYGEHYAPHDIEVRELTTGRSRKETARSIGIVFRTAPMLGIEDGIHAVRMHFNYFWFDKVKCKRLIDAIKSYHKEFDEKNKIFRNHPEHDWSSHGCDALRTFAISFNKNKLNKVVRQSPFASAGLAPDRSTLEYANRFGIRDRSHTALS